MGGIALLLAFALMCFGLVNLRLDLLGTSVNQWVKGQVLRLVIGIPLCALWVYLTLPAMINPVGYTVLLLPLGINAFLTMILRSAHAPKGTKASALGGLPLLVLLVSLLIPLYLNLLVVPIKATTLRDVPVVQEAHEPIAVMDTAHIRLVPIETARWKAQKVVGNLGTGFEVGQLSIQMVDGKLYWVAPLEFRGLFKWFSFKEAPGYVIVDGEDPDAPAELRQSRFIYTPSAFFGKDLARHIYSQHSDVLLLEPSMELDDQFKPWYVMSVGTPTVGKTGVKVTGVVIADPADGSMQSYDMQSVPAWVDQVIPEYLAEQHNYWFGRYVHGFWNSLLGQRDVHVPTEWDGAVDVFGVIGADSRFYWFTGHTSPSTEDDSLMGYTMMDGRTGNITYYRNAAGYFNEAAAVSSVNAAVSNFAGWHGAQPLLYNLYGSESYVVPVLSENSKLQAIGIVNAKSGQTIVKPTKAEALLIYRQYLGSGLGEVVPTQTGSVKNLQGKVVRTGSAAVAGNTLFYFTIEGSDRIFTASSSISSEVAITKVGDTIRVSYLDTAETTVPLSTLENLTIRPR